MQEDPAPSPQYIQLAIQLSQFNETLCANQATFTAWQNAQNGCLPNTSQMFQEWLEIFFTQSADPNTDGPNNPVWGDLYTLLVFPILNALGVWNQLQYLYNTASIDFNPSFLSWWKSSGATFVTSLNSYLPFQVSITFNATQFSIGQCTNPSMAATNLIALCQNYSATNIYNNMGLCAWNDLCYQQALQSNNNYPIVPPVSTYNCEGSCSGTSCACISSASPPPAPPCFTSYCSIFVISTGTVGDKYPFLVAANSLTGANQTVLNMSPLFPCVLAITPNGQYAYIASQDNSSGTDILTVSVVDLSTNAVITQIVGDEWRDPSDIAITPDGEYVYITEEASNVIDVISTSTNTLVTIISDPSISAPTAIAITPNGQYAYVTSFYTGIVVVIDIATNTAIQQLNLPFPDAIAIAPNGQYAYIDTQDNIAIIELPSNTTLGMVSNANFDGITAIAFTPDGNYAYVANSQNSSVSVIDTSTHSVITTITENISTPMTLTISSSGDCVFVGNGNNNISMIDITNNTVINVININTPSGYFPSAIALLCKGS